MASKDAIEVIEPATEQVMAEVPRAGIEETDAAVERAKRAFPGWRAIAPGERSALLHRLANAIEERADDLATLEARNAGKPISDARGEIGMVVETFRYYAGAPERLTGKTIPVAGGVDMTFREPLGVVGLITPWNFPLTIASSSTPTSPRSPSRARPRWGGESPREPREPSSASPWSSAASPPT